MYFPNAVAFSALLVASTTLGVVAPAFAESQQTAPQLFQGWLNDYNKSGASAKTGTVSFDEKSNVLVVENLALSVGGAEGESSTSTRSYITVGRLTLTALAADAQAVRADAVQADNIAVVEENSTDSGFSLDHVELGSISLPNLSHVTVDSQHPLESQASILRQLDRLTLASGTGRGLRFGQVLTVQSFSLGKIGEGHIANLTLSEGTLSSKAADPGTNSEASVGTISLSGLDMDAYQRVIDHLSYQSSTSDRPWYDFASALRLTDVKVQNARTIFSLSLLEAGPVKLRLFPQDLTEILDEMILVPEFSAKNRDKLELVSDGILDSIALDGAELSGVTVEPVADNSQIKIAVGKLSASDLSASGLSEASLSSFNMSDNGGTISAGQVLVGDVHFGSTRAIVDGVAMNGGATQAKAVTLPTLGRVQASALVVATENVTFSLDSLDTRLNYYIGAMPTNVRLNLSGLKLSVASIPNPSLVQFIEALGYNKLNLDVDLIGAWQDSANEFAFERVALSSEDMGKVSLSGTLTGITQKSFLNPKANFAGDLAGAGLKNFRLKYEEFSLFDRSFKYLSDQLKQRPDDFKKVLTSNMPGIMANIADAGTRNRFVFAAIAFLNTPKSLEVFATDNGAVPLSKILPALATPANLPKLMKLDVSANKPG